MRHRLLRAGLGAIIMLLVWILVASYALRGVLYRAAGVHMFFNLNGPSKEVLDDLNGPGSLVSVCERWPTSTWVMRKEREGRASLLLHCRSFVLPAYDQGQGGEKPVLEKRPVVVFFHDAGHTARRYVEERMLDPFRWMGFHVVLLEYPGHDGSLGVPNHSSITRACVKALSLLSCSSLFDTRIVIYHGYSLGTMTSCEAARTMPPSALILQSAPASNAELVKQFHVPPIVSVEAFSSIDALEQLPETIPVLLMHGIGETVVSPYNAHLMFENLCHARGQDAEAAMDGEPGTNVSLKFFNHSHEWSHESCQHWGNIHDFLHRHYFI